MKKEETVNLESGFTLIEVLIALTIFAIGLLAIAGMQITAIQGNSKAHSVTAKVALASGIIEEIMALSGDDDFFTTEQTNAAWVTAKIAGAGECSSTITVDMDPVIDGTTYNDMTQVVVQVTNPDSNVPVEQTIMKRRY
ncbi:type IV pilus modification PilV family protein [Vibrio sp.]|uniref:type IV pilus modification PilV family protein n=1 Tax=Vibrio sp. TaxID=678 RepID=UPI003D0E43CD